MEKERSMLGMPKVGMRDVRRQQIFEAAAAIIAQRGFHRTTIREVAERAGVSTGTVNHYFSNKLDLLVTTLEYVAEAFKAKLIEAVAAEAPGLPQIEAYARITLQGIDADAVGWKVWVTAWSEATRSQEVRDIIQRRRKSLYLILRDVVQGVDGTLEVGAVDAFAREFEAFVSGLGLNMVTGEEGLVLDEGIEAALGFAKVRLGQLAGG